MSSTQISSVSMRCFYFCSLNITTGKVQISNYNRNNFTLYAPWYANSTCTWDRIKISPIVKSRSYLITKTCSQIVSKYSMKKWQNITQYAISTSNFSPSSSCLCQETSPITSALWKRRHLILWKSNNICQLLGRIWYWLSK